MMSQQNYIKAILFASFLPVAFCASAQDTIRRRTVEVSSQFKPVLKDAAKINFNATPPTADTTRPRLSYQVPNQNLQFVYQPGMLKPLALDIDTGGRWNNESYVKAGFGSLSTPFFQAGLSVGDGKSVGLNLYAKHVSSKGKIDYQKYSNTQFDAAAFFQTANSHEWNARLGAEGQTQYRYGFAKGLTFSDDSLKIKYQTWRGRLGFHNLKATEFGLTYAPEVRVEVFNDQHKNSESNTYINLPLKKTLGETFEVDVAAEASLSKYKPDEKDRVNNNYLTLSPTLLFKKPNLNITAGLKPSWDNSEFKLFPNVIVEAGTMDKRFAIQLGWTGYLRNSGYQYTAGFNPWIWRPSTVNNTRIEERFAGVKGAVGDHFAFSAKMMYNRLNNQPLFLNSLVNGGKSFEVIYEPKMDQFQLGGEMGLTFGERFSLISNLAINQYRKLEVNDKPWGLLPLEFTTKLRLQVLKDLYVHTDMYVFDGPWYQNASGDAKQSKGSMDLTAGAEFNIVKNIKLWAQFNNILGKEYQRWNQYPVYGFNFMGGVVFSFAQNNSK
jgi:hypothetical protein